MTPPVSADVVRAARLARRACEQNPRAGFVPGPPFRGLLERGLRRGDRVLARAANRTGKTTHAAYLVARTLEENPGIRLRGVSVDYSQQRKAMGLHLQRFLSPGALVDGCNFNETRGWSHNLVRLRNGSSLQLMNYTQDPQAFEGDSLDGIWCDEPPPVRAWAPNISRLLDRNGWFVVTATMVGRPVQYLRDIVEDEASRWRQVVVRFGTEACPWYSEEQARAWIAEAKAAPWEYEQRINAAWEGIATGRRYTGYTEESIVERLPPGVWTVGVGIDHGELGTNQVAVLLLWDEATRRMYVADEYVGDGPSTIKDDARGIVAMLRRNGLRPLDVDEWTGDNNSAGKARVGLKVNDLLGEELGVEISPPDKTAGSVETGEYLVNLALLQGRLLVKEGLVAVDKTMRYYDGSEALKHISDAIRYRARPVLSAWDLQAVGRLYWT